jgi:hypothetical protein
MSRLRRQVRAAVAVMTGLGLPVALPAASASAADPLPTAHCRRDADAAGRRRRFLGRDRATPLRRWPLLQGQAGRAAPGGAAGEVYRHNLLAFDAAGYCPGRRTAAALSGARVLVVDAAVRSHGLSDVLGLRYDPHGLTSIAAGRLHAGPRTRRPCLSVGCPGRPVPRGDAGSLPDEPEGGRVDALCLRPRPRRLRVTRHRSRGHADHPRLRRRDRGGPPRS